MNNTSGKLKWQTKQSLISLDFCTSTEKQETSKVELGFTVTQPRAAEMLSGVVLSDGRRPPRAPHSPCAASLRCPAQI